MKKNILVIFTGAMELGGIERSLIGLLDAIDYDLYDVDLFLYAHHGPLFNQINSKVNILPEVRELAYLRESLGEKMKHGCFLSVFYRMRDEIRSHYQTIDFDRTWAEIMRKCAPELGKHYDLAISFFRPFDYIAEKVNADLKVGWIHTDYSYGEIDRKSLLLDYQRLDKIVAVSESCKEAFDKVLPELKEKTLIIENILSKEFILEQAEKRTEDVFVKRENEIILLSVGRFCEAKNFDNLPDICRRIVEKGYSVKWYLIGFGADESKILQKIEETGMQDHVIILGKKENPYPYMKGCDIYIQPSRYEGKCVSVREAQILGKPVVITNYATAESQIVNGYDGVIVPIDNEGCANGIVTLIEDTVLQKKLIQNLENIDYTNAKEVEKIYQMME